MDTKFWIEVIKELGSLGLLGLLIYYFVRVHMPNLTGTFKESLDSILESHSASMNKIDESMGKMSDELSSMRTAVEICKFRQKSDQ
jgi:hypothetical protein